MIGVVLSNRQLLCGLWTRTKYDYILTDLTVTTLYHPLKDILHDEGELNSVFQTAIHHVTESFPLERNKVVIALEDDLIFQSLIVTEPDLSRDDAWTYISWAMHKRWGDRVDNYSTFAQVYPKFPNQYQIISCPSNLINAVKASVYEAGADPVWMGSASESMMNGDWNNRTVFIFDRGKSFDLWHRGDRGLVNGIIRFVYDKPIVVSHIGSKENLEDLFSLDEMSILFRSVDHLSDKKKAHWAKRKFSVITPFEGVIVEGISMPEDASLRDLNVLTSLIIGNAPEVSVNLLAKPGVHDIIGASNNEFLRPMTETLHEIHTGIPKDKTGELNKSSNIQTVVIFILILIVFFSLLFLRLDKSDLNFSFLTKYISGKPAQEESKVFLVDKKPYTHYPFQIQNAVNSSQSLLRAMEQVLRYIRIDNLLLLSISDLHLKVEWAGTDSIELISVLDGIPLAETENGSKHSLEFKLNEIETELQDNWLDLESFEALITASFNNLQFRILTINHSEELTYDRIEIKVNSLREILDLHGFVNGLAVNVLVREIIITRNPEARDLSAVYYITVVKKMLNE